MRIDWHYGVNKDLSTAIKEARAVGYNSYQIIDFIQSMQETYAWTVIDTKKGVGLLGARKSKSPEFIVWIATIAKKEE